MKQFIIKALKEYLLGKRLTIEMTTSKERVQKLLQTLYPYQTEYKLIRLGPLGDGGYLIPDHLDGIEACFSPGVSSISGFELDCINRNMKVFMADKSVERPNWDMSPDKYDFIKKFIGCTNNAEFITMDQWVSSSGVSEASDLLLQMDIEGAEYYAFLNMSDSLMNRFRIMVVEFHSLHDLWNPHYFNLAQTAFEKILQTHICVHIHPNNCCGVHSIFDIDIPRGAEFTFLRKDCVRSMSFVKQFPHPLDSDNTTNAHIPLPKSWYNNDL
jgi:hypothetical protein